MSAKPSVQPSWPEWLGTVVVWALIVGGVAAYAIVHNYHTAPIANDTSDVSAAPAASPSSASSQAPNPVSTSLGSHNGIPEVSPGQAEANSTCTDVTSFDYDWNDDVLCTKPDGSQFYTNYAGGRAADVTFER
ncbi:MAG TPA: hypothetical protein VLG11_01540 [Candidatus Saccharimonadales bacterium]|nr:hypothetical protein [Candidatus Saccharimonadales bacterium]